MRKSIRRGILLLLSLTLAVSGLMLPAGALAKENTFHMDQGVCSMGYMARTLDHRKKGDWYTVTPVDLSEQGTFTYDLIAANMHYIGTLTMTVDLDEVTLSYEFLPNVVEQSMAFTFLPEWVKGTKLKEVDRTAFTWGEPLSIEKDLGGDTRVLLSVLGWIGYDHLGKEYPRFVRAHDKKYKDFLKKVKPLMD